MPPPTDNVQKKPLPASATGLMDDDEHVGMMNDKLKDIKMHEAITPAGQQPLKRTDTDTGEIDAFVDPEN